MTTGLTTALSSSVQTLRRHGVDRAVAYGVLSKAWALLAGPITVILISSRFSRELQGYYYTFATTLALQVFVELGLGMVIVQFASHEWSKLGLDREQNIVGDADALSRLQSLAHIGLRWFCVGGVLLVGGLAIAGFVLFSADEDAQVAWKLPWLLICLVSGASVCLVPLWSLLEGCNQVRSLYGFRFYEGVLSSTVIWVAMWYGASLWTGGIAGSAVLFFGAAFLALRYQNFIRTLVLTKPSGPTFVWRTDLLPMQWRIAVTWISGFLIYSILVPVTFHFQGSVAAGQLGMSWSLVSVLSVAGAYLSPKVPGFAMLIAAKKYRELDTAFFRSTIIYSGIAVMIAALLLATVWLLNIVQYPLAERLALRLLPVGTMALLIVAQLLMTLSVPFSYYMFAHKKNPIALLTVVNTVLTATSTVMFAKFASVAAMVTGFALIQCAMIPAIFFIWSSSRRTWHAA